MRMLKQRIHSSERIILVCNCVRHIRHASSASTVSASAQIPREHCDMADAPRPIALLGVHRFRHATIRKLTDLKAFTCFVCGKTVGKAHAYVKHTAGHFPTDTDELCEADLCKAFGVLHVRE